MIKKGSKIPSKMHVRPTPLHGYKNVSKDHLKNATNYIEDLFGENVAWQFDKKAKYPNSKEFIHQLFLEDDLVKNAINAPCKVDTQIGRDFAGDRDAKKILVLT